MRGGEKGERGGERETEKERERERRKERLESEESTAEERPGRPHDWEVTLLPSVTLRQSKVYLEWPKEGSAGSHEVTHLLQLTVFQCGSVSWSFNPPVL